VRDGSREGPRSWRTVRELGSPNTEGSNPSTIFLRREHTMPNDFEVEQQNKLDALTYLRASREVDS
jgi:hypothetical protein